MSAFYDGVGNSHNIMANEKSKTIFIGGATIAPTNVPTSGGTLCGGKSLCPAYFNHTCSFLGKDIEYRYGKFSKLH